MIAFVILHYQAIKETRECIQSIMDNVSSEYKIVIVDNASPNGSGYQLKIMYKDNPNIIVILNKRNDGFAKGNNLGFREAKKYSPRYIVVLNSDTLLLQSNFVELLEKAYNDYGFDVLGPDIYSTKGQYHQNPQRKDNYTVSELKKAYFKLYIKNIFKFLIKIKYCLKDGNKIIPCGDKKKNVEYAQIGVVLHGAFIVYSEKYINNHEECFYNETFMYYESYILHYLGHRENLIFLYYPDIKINHLEDVSTDCIYRTFYTKSVFTNKCLLDSCKIFIQLLEKENIKLR